MALLSERLAFILQLDAQGAIKGFQEVGKEADRSLGKADDRLNKLSGQMTKFGAGMMAASGVAATGLFKLGNTAAEQNAAFAALGQVLGESAEAVEDWADNSVRAVGLSRRAALEAATQFGGIAKSAKMSTEEVAAFAIEQTQLAADMAAFKNVDPAEAIRDLQAGYAGSTEVLRKYNIFVDDATLKAALFRETGQKVTGTLTSQQRIIAMHAEIMRQSADMQGQWNREIGEAPSQQAMLMASLEDFAAGVGQGVLPVMTDLLEGANSVTGAFNDLGDGTQAAIGSFATWATIGTGLVGTLSFVGGQALKMRDRFTTLGDDGTRSLNKLGKAAAGMGVATAFIGAAAAIDGFLNKDFVPAEEAFRDIGKAADDALIPAIREAAQRTEELMSETDIFEQVARTSIGTAQRLSEQLRAQGEDTAELDEIIRREIEGQRQQTKDTEAGADAIQEAGGAARGTAQAQLSLADATKQAAAAARSQASAFRSALDATYGAGNRAREADDAIADFTDSLRESSSAGGGAARSIDRVAEKQKALEQATRDSERANEQHVESIRRLEDAQRDVVTAQEDLERALRGPTERDRAEALNDQRRAELALEESKDRVTKAQEALTEAEESGDEDAIAEKRRALTRAQLDLEDATWRSEDATKAYTDVAGWSAENDTKVRDARDKLATAQERVEKATRETATRYSELQAAQEKQDEVNRASLGTFGEGDGKISSHRDRVNEAADAYYRLRDAIFSQVEAILSSQTVQAQTLDELNALEAKVKAIPGLSGEQRGALLGAIYSGKASAIGFTSDFAGFATGTASVPPGDFVAGEHGPELMRRTPTGIEILDAGRTRSMRGGSGGGGLNFYGPVTFGADMATSVRELDWYDRVRRAGV